MPARDNYTDEDVKRFVAEIEKEDAARVESINAGKLAIREKRRQAMRAEIENRIRERYLFGDKQEAETRLMALQQEAQALETTQRPTSTAAITERGGMPVKIAGVDQQNLNTKYGYQLVYTNVAKGTYWKTMEANKKEDDGTRTAITCTVLDLQQMPKAKKENYQKQAYKIVRFLEKNQQPNIVRFYDQFLIDTDYYSFHERLGYNLEALLVKGPAFSIARAKKWGYDLICAINFLHSHGIAHRNISPNTVWLTSSFEVRLANFGYSCLFWDHKQKSMVSVKGIKKSDDKFSAPEDNGSAEIDAVKADIWSWGATVAFIMTKEVPPRDSSITTYADEKLEALNADGRGLLKAALDTEPSGRPYASAAKHHLWFRNFYVVKVVEPIPAPEPAAEEPQAESSEAASPETPMEPMPDQ